ncbi:hypothetical protein MTP03_37550 [Tsukamurella sp. PLM1]|nr:SRPBCC family protein [Tsukamurella sp. PLM1]BDH58816.1 hypothetical protein MTP03_37550 [Tsukamurella sp. PLM1]
MVGRIHNVHERVVAAPPDALAPLLDALGGTEDVLWPAPAWEPMILDGPPVAGADGGHGPIRYRVVEAERGRRIRFEFHSTPGIEGYHEISVEDAAGGATLIRHVLDCRAHGRMRLVGPVLLEPLHDAVLEDLLDNAERGTTGAVSRPARWSRWVRLLRVLDRPAVHAVGVPGGAVLARRALADQAESSGALVDAFAVPVWRGCPSTRSTGPTRSSGTHPGGCVRRSRCAGSWRGCADSAARNRRAASRRGSGRRTRFCWARIRSTCGSGPRSSWRTVP